MGKKGEFGCFSSVANMNTLPPTNVDILPRKIAQEVEKPLSVLLWLRTHQEELLIQQNVNADSGWG